MKSRLIISLFLLLLFSFLLISASKEAGPLYSPDPIKFNIPPGWPKPPGNIFTKNKLTEQGFQLGRKLFHDGNLSRDGNISCGSCHQQFAAFSTFDHDLSHGVNNTFSTRNAPALFNLAWMKELHWDGAINHIEVQPLSPLTAENEMGQNLDSLVSKIKNDTSYQRMFKAAFGNKPINSQRILKALAQFTGSLVSSNSKYDKVKRGENTFTLYEQRGYNIYKVKCASCHPEPLFTDYSYRNNGLALHKKSDLGRYMISQDPNDSFKFKVPSLRNIQVTYPYMHDGRIYSVPQVIDHYTSNIDISQRSLDPLLKNKIAISRQEKTDLTYFLYTLTDSSFLKDPRFGTGNTIQRIKQGNDH
ncbi:MAG: cytochrome c peroxidase [Ferruginibacter sp.]